jgi:FkbM family methyltransferase
MRVEAVSQFRVVEQLRKVIDTLGVGPTTATYVAFKLGNRLGVPRGPALPMRNKLAKFAVHCRAGTSDVDVFGQIFVHREYRCLDHLSNPGLIIDCGANVGYSSAYFLTRFPGAFVIAVEPDAGNFAVLEKNLRPFEGRYRAVNSAVWSRPAPLVMSEETFADGREWARTVREARPGERPAMTATDVGTLLAESGYDRISLLKVDIEGGEREVFGEGAHPWLDMVDNMVIELHGEECAAIFHRAIDGSDFDVSLCDELTVCLRRTAVSGVRAGLEVGPRARYG